MTTPPPPPRPKPAGYYIDAPARPRRPIGAAATVMAAAALLGLAFLAGRATASDASTATCDPTVTNPDGSSHQLCTYPTPGGDTTCTTPHSGTDATTGDVQVAITLCDPTAAALRAQLRRERAIHAGELRRLRTELRAARRTWRPTVQHAISLAAATYGVPATKLTRVATCESTLNPTAQSGRYLGLYQFGLPLWHRTPYGAFDRTDPYAAALAAAWAFSRGMHAHWPVCGTR